MRYKVETGVRYRARIELDWLESLADNETVADKFREVGFQDVEVTGDGATRYAEGTWIGDPDEAEIPSQVKDIEVVA